MYEFVTWSLEIANDSCSDNLADIKKRANDIFLKINIIQNKIMSKNKCKIVRFENKKKTIN